ncbi:MAG: hypothetical protein WDA08_00370 [Weeksellaceae bacterium]
MKKIFFGVAMVVLALGFTSCSSDDDVVVADPMVGVWKAETVSYTFGGETHTFPYNIAGGPFEGCEVDFLTLSNDNSASLLEHIKNDANVCEDVTSIGSWTDEIVNVKDTDRIVDALSETTLTLTYPIVFYGQSLPITVNYSKQ